MISFLLTLAGSVGLCLSMRKHARQVFGKTLPSKRTLITLKVAGWLLLVTAVFAAVAADGLGLGLTLFVAYLNVAVFAIALLLAYRNATTQSSNY